MKKSFAVPGFLSLALGLVLLFLGSCSQPLETLGAPRAGGDRAATSPAWKAYTAYKTGDFASYLDVDYQCLQGHTSLPGWEPPNVAALWKKGTPSVTVPAVPTGLAAAAASSTSITVTWKASTGAATYDVEADGTVKTNVTSPWTQTGLAAKSPHSYRVRAANAAGASAWSTAVTATTNAQDTVPAVPTGLAVTAPSSSSLTATWQPVTGATSYDLEVDAVVRATVISPYNLGSLAASSTHAFRVRAVNAAGASPWSASVSGTTLPPVTIPAVPTGLAASAASSSSIGVTWQPVTGAASYDLEVDAVTKTGVTSPWSHTGLAAQSTHSYRVRAVNAAGASPWSAAVSATTTTVPPTPKKLLVGYWHNFDNGTGFLRLKDVSDAWDVINVAFADVAADQATASFTPYSLSVADFQADVAALHAKGKKVVISVGGQNGALSLGTPALRDAFVASIKSVITTYGFDGLDLDVETGIAVSSGDLNLDNPTTPAIVNLIAATRTVCDAFGPNFILSMAPEIAYVQGGITAFGGPWGGYLPIIHKLRDKLTWLHVQHYNAGGSAAPDGKNYNQGTADFQVAMVDMLLSGFNIGGDPAHPFPPLREDQVMVGLPATGPAAPSGGYITPAEMTKALNYLLKGQSFGGSYAIRKAGGYPGFRGLMTWSINWDAKAGFEFSKAYRPYLSAF